MEETNEKLMPSVSYAFCANGKKRTKLVAGNRYFCSVDTEWEMVSFSIIATDVLDLFRQVVEFIESDEDRFGTPDYGSLTYNISNR